MFSIFGIRGKLLAFSCTMAAMAGAVGGIGYYSLISVATPYQHIAQANLPNVTALGEMQATQRAMRVRMRSLAIPGFSEQAEKAINEVKDLEAKYMTADKLYTDGPFEAGEEELYNRVNSEWKKYTELVHQTISMYRSSAPGDHDKFLDLTLKVDPQSAVGFKTAFENLLKYHRNAVAVSTQTAESALSAGKKFLLSLVLVSLVLSFTIGALFSNTLSKALLKLVDIISNGASEVASASSEISSSSESLSTSATEQSAAIQETSAAVQEVSSTIEKTAQRATQSKEISQNSSQSANQGMQVVGEMIEAINEINQSNASIVNQVEEGNREISEIVKVIVEIGNKTKVINDIVFQTKLLSFNASVEAARAGEHGKGFAVVAEEVGNLAQMSGKAAQEISDMLSGSIQRVEGIVQNTQTKITQLVEVGKQKVEKGSTVANRCGKVLEALVSDVDKVNQMMSEISAGAQEQSIGMKEISQAMNQLDQVNHQNTAASQQSSAASTELTAQAESLRMTVFELLRVVQGSNGNRSSSSTVRDKVSISNPNSEQPAKPATNTGNNVVQLARSKSSQPSTTGSWVTPQKRVSGSDVTPDDQDPRFNDV